MTIQNKTFAGLTILALLFASIAALLAGSLLAGGIPLTTLQEIPEGLTQEQIPSATTAFYPSAVPMLLSALVLIGGLFTRKLCLTGLRGFNGFKHFVSIQ
ncbi:MAG: hypothetical protein Fur0022_08560 [Anaerolineales bacterium]